MIRSRVATGEERTREWKRVKACRVGRIDKRQRLAGGGYGHRPCGRHYTPVEDGKSKCGREMWQRRNATDGGAVVQSKDQERSRKG